MLARSEERQCSEWAGQGYHCVPYYNCDECDSIIVDGSSLFDPRRAEENCATSENTFSCVLLVLKLYSAAVLSNTCSGQEHRLATTSQCAKQLHVCCRHPDFPIPEDKEANEGDYEPQFDGLNSTCGARQGKSGLVCDSADGEEISLEDVTP